MKKTGTGSKTVKKGGTMKATPKKRRSNATSKNTPLTHSYPTKKKRNPKNPLFLNM